MDYTVPGYIIEKLKELERQKQERAYKRPYLEIPLPPPYIEPPAPEEDGSSEDTIRRGPIVIDIDTYEIIEEGDE